MKALSLRKDLHKIIVIDEIDSFSSQERAFNLLLTSILKANTNTSIIGIANSVDLPFKK
jgi:Cdc6-like AAA superfamily ATPase